jgi:hypothetical protein
LARDEPPDSGFHIETGHSPLISTRVKEDILSAPLRILAGDGQALEAAICFLE